MSETLPDLRRTVELLLLRVAPTSSTAGDTKEAPSTDNESPSLVVADDTPRATMLTPHQACVVMVEDDAALLVLALTDVMRPAATACTTLSAEELDRVRRIATVVHRTLARSVRLAVRARAEAHIACGPTTVRADAAA